MFAEYRRVRVGEETMRLQCYLTSATHSWKSPVRRMLTHLLRDADQSWKRWSFSSVGKTSIRERKMDRSTIFQTSRASLGCMIIPLKVYQSTRNRLLQNSDAAISPKLKKRTRPTSSSSPEQQSGPELHVRCRRHWSGYT